MKRCMNQGPTISFIISDTGKIFGGYTPISWDGSNSYKADTSGESFLFSINNKSII